MTRPSRPSVAFIAVGSNVKPRQNIVVALTMLKEDVHVSASSTFYRTVPLGSVGQPDFVNGVWRIETVLSPVQVKNNVLKRIEGRLGRIRTDDKFAPRTIDLDLALYNDLVVNDGDLILPHPDVQRPFVYDPILELLESGSGEIGPDVLVAMKALLAADLPRTVPGEPLRDFTDELRRLLS